MAEKPYASRSAQGEMEAARFAVSFENLFVKLEGSDHKLLSFANRPLHVGTQFVQR